MEQQEVDSISLQRWELLISFVLQNIMGMALEVIPAPDLYSRALECAVYVSKMDDDSI